MLMLLVPWISSGSWLDRFHFSHEYILETDIPHDRQAYVSNYLLNIFTQISTEDTLYILIGAYMLSLT